MSPVRVIAFCFGLALIGLLFCAWVLTGTEYGKALQGADLLICGLVWGWVFRSVAADVESDHQKPSPQEAEEKK